MADPAGCLGAGAAESGGGIGESSAELEGGAASDAGSARGDGCGPTRADDVDASEAGTIGAGRDALPGDAGATGTAAA